MGRLLVLLVIIVPHIVPLAFVSTALGAHKSVSTLSFPVQNPEVRSKRIHRLNKQDRQYRKPSRVSYSTYSVSSTPNAPLVIICQH